MVICFEEDPKIGYLQKLILFLSVFRQSDVAITTKECFGGGTGLGSFFSLIILFICIKLNQTNLYTITITKLSKNKFKSFKLINK